MLMMAAMHSFLTHPSSLRHPRPPHAPLPMLSPSIRRPLFSFVSEPATMAAPSRNGLVINCLPPVGRHVNEGQGDELPPGLRKESMPSHVAVIMDGNRRRAWLRGWPTALGYEPGLRALTAVADMCCKWRIRVLTSFLSSSENMIYLPKLEVESFMVSFEQWLRNDLPHFMRQRVRISHIGDSTKLPKSLQSLLGEAAETTKNNSHLHLILAIDYSGQNDIVQACQSLAPQVKYGLIEPQDIDKSLLESELQTNCTDISSPDLLIRTSELSISNFLLWQLAYTELYFSDSLWPDFGEDEFVKALSSFQQRERRFGGRNP